MSRSVYGRPLDLLAKRTLISFFTAFLSSALFAQTWSDSDYKVPSSLNVGMLDTVRIFDPAGVKMVETYVNASRFKKKGKLDKGEAYVGRTKFDEQRRLASHQVFLLGAYSVEADRYIGFHTETYEHRYPSDRELVIDYANTKMLTKYSWFYKDSLLQECRYYQGEYPFLRAFWKWEYSEDSLILAITKFNADTIPIYHSSYSYTDFGKVSQIQTTTVAQKINFVIFEYDQSQQLINRTFFRKLKKVPRDLYAIRDGVFVRKSSRPIEEEKMRADRWTYRYDEMGRLREKTHTNHRGELESRIELTYTSDGRIQSKSFQDGYDRDKFLYYNYSENGELSSIDYRGVTHGNLDTVYTFEYDERGNARRCYYSHGSLDYRFDFDYEYFSEK